LWTFDVARASLWVPRTAGGWIWKEIFLLDLLAYIDPGSGSLLVQAIIATVVAVPFFFRQQIARAIRTVRRSPAEPAPTVDVQREGAQSPEA
jgi:hypothetical protein